MIIVSRKDIPQDILSDSVLAHIAAAYFSLGKRLERKTRCSATRGFILSTLRGGATLNILEWNGDLCRHKRTISQTPALTCFTDDRLTSRPYHSAAKDADTATLGHVIDGSQRAKIPASIEFQITQRNQRLAFACPARTCMRCQSVLLITAQRALFFAVCLFLNGCHNQPSRSAPNVTFDKIPVANVGGPDRLDTI